MKPLDFSDWFSVAVAAFISGIGGAMAWFNGHKQAINARVDTIKEDVLAHTTSIAVVQTCQENTRQRLDEIGETTRDTNQSLKELSQTITQIALGMKK